MPHDRMLATRDTYTWIQKYIFPGGLLPSVRAIDESVARAHLAARDGAAVASGRTTPRRCGSGARRFDSHAAEVEALGFDETFRRMWRLYLGYSEAGFRSGYLDVQQIVLERRAVTTTTERVVRDQPAGVAARLAALLEPALRRRAARSGCAPGTAARPARPARRS